MDTGSSQMKRTVVQIYSPALTWNTAWLSKSHLLPFHYNHNWGITIKPDYSFGAFPDSLPSFLFPPHTQKSFGLLPHNSRWVTHHFQLGVKAVIPEYWWDGKDWHRALQHTENILQAGTLWPYSNKTPELKGAQLALKQTATAHSVPLWIQCCLSSCRLTHMHTHAKECKRK